MSKSSDLSLRQAGIHCLSWSFGLFVAVVILYHSGLLLPLFVDLPLALLKLVGHGVTAWWTFIRGFGSYQWHVFGALIATAVSMFRLSFVFAQYAQYMTPAFRDRSFRILRLMYIFTYLHIGFVSPLEWEFYMPILVVVYVFFGIFSFIMFNPLHSNFSSGENASDDTESDRKPLFYSEG